MKTKLLLFAVILGSVTFFTSCSDDAVTPSATAYDFADASKGGVMYDTFWSSEAGFDTTKTAYATLKAKPDFFKCKQCHAWDGYGNAVSYISRAAKTSRPNVSSLNLYAIAHASSADELFADLKSTAGRRSITTDLSTYNPATPSTQVEGDKMPNLNEILTDAQLWDLVKFLKGGMADVATLYDFKTTGAYPTGTFAYTNLGKGASEVNGNAYYSTAGKCVSCHGTDGKKILFGGKTSLGAFARSSSHELQQKVKYGQLGSSMTGAFTITDVQMQELYAALANKTNYPD